MGGMSGFNMMHPFSWFASAGDSTGDVSHNHGNAPDGNFWNATNALSGTAHPADATSLSSPAGTVAPAPLGTYAPYVNSSLQNPGSQHPLSGSPTIMNGPQQGPLYVSGYNAGIPGTYISAAPPWKNGPMMAAANQLPAAGQAAIHATGTNPPTIAVNAPTAAAKGSGTCSGCSGGCGKAGSQNFCRGKGSHQAVELDSTNDFPPLYSHYQASATQTVNAALYAGVSTHSPAWTVAQGGAADHEQPLQGQ